jgi:hypothetical protein
MVTVAAARPSAPAGAYDRVFYSSMAIVMAITVFVGFAPSFYLRSYFHGATPAGATELTWLAKFHGAVFTSWVMLFIVQTALVAQHRVQVHRKLGIAGGVLAGFMVVVGVTTALRAAARGAAPPGVDPLAFLAVPLFDMVLFTIFVGAALFKRRDKEAHKRLMLLAYISIIVAAVARFPGVLPLGPLAFFGFAFIFALIGMAYDFATRRRVHLAYLWGTALLVVSVPLRLGISGTAAWQAFARFATGT